MSDAGEFNEHMTPETARAKPAAAVWDDIITALNPSSMITRTTRIDGGYVLNAARNRITNSPIADVCVVWARSDT